jgi:hypothetical protein
MSKQNFGLANCGPGVPARSRHINKAGVDSFAVERSIETRCARVEYLLNSARPITVRGGLIATVLKYQIRRATGRAEETVCQANTPWWGDRLFAALRI